MESLLIMPKDKQEFQLMSDFLTKIKMKSRVMSIEDREDFALAELMKEADRSKKVSRTDIMKKLRN